MGSGNNNSQSRLPDPSTWLDQYGDHLFRYAMSRLRDRQVSEDLVQDTLLAAIQGRERFSGRSSVKTWLVGILKNKMIDHFRKVAREPDIAGGDDSLDIFDRDFASGGLLPERWKTGRSPVPWTLDPVDISEQKEFWRYLLLCLEGVDQRQALLFVLREMEELDSKEICNVMDISPTNLRVTLYRVRMALRRCLETNWIGVEGSQ